MGPSGSGKTSLLNVLAGRLALAKGSKFTGDIKVNDRVLRQKDFGKIACFVMQDDILVPTMTPRESFEFALKITTNLTNEQVKEKVDELVKRLGLRECQNTMNGGKMIKGISGGERKRTSIGIELITNPKLLLCDEPTSGLDSHTALKIAELLK
jgi:ABC-type multidrug transport system ATPase subunit